MRRRKPQKAMWRRSLMAVAMFGQRRRRHSRGRPLRFLGVVLGLLFLAITSLARLAWKIVYFVLFHDPAKARAEKESRRRGKRLRDTAEWKSYFRDARAIFVRTAERALGPENLECACCPTKFPTHGRRGFHVDHIFPVANYPELSFDIENFQLLCETCNIHKSDSHPMVTDRRPLKLRSAAERARRDWLRKHDGVDPIHAMIAAHDSANRKQWLGIKRRGERYA